MEYPRSTTDEPDSYELPLISSEKWEQFGACVPPDVDPDLFSSPDLDYKEPKAARERREIAAKAICQTCPVVDSCLLKAYRTDDRVSIMGGKTPDERQALVRGRRAA
jgi:WhiB family redox-sensing transcriptional regulator